MEFIETTADVERRLTEAQANLEAFENDVSDEQAWARLRAAYPVHPVILARWLFLGLCLLATTGTFTTFALPFVEPHLDPVTRHALPLRILPSIEQALGAPLPLAFGTVALALGVAWFMAGMAGITIGRDCPLRPWEYKEHQKLAEEVKRLTQQKAAMERLGGTPMGARPRSTSTSTPAPVSRAPLPAAPQLDPDELVTFDDDLITPPTSFGTPSPGFTGTPAPARRPSTDAPPGFSRVAPPPSDDGLVSFGAPDPDYLDAHGVLNRSVRDTGNFDRRIATRIPDWGPIEDTWLEEVLGRVETVAQYFPFQARIEFSTDRDLPFTLVLERATVGMAVRAMMQFVEFLGQIPTPRRARVELRTGTLDHNFHRNVISALEPFFSNAFEVVRKDDTIDIEFAASDPRWRKYPYLPM